MIVGEKNISILGNFLLALCAVILLSELWGISYTTGDDLYLAIARHKEGGVFAVALNAAMTQGRFYQLLIYPLVQLPNLFEPFLALNIVRSVSNALPFLAFYFMAQQLFSHRVAKTASFIGIGLFAVTGSFNPFHTLPLWFNTNAFLLMLSIAFYHRRMMRNQSLILPSALYFSSLLFYESFLLYLPVFAAIYWHACGRNNLSSSIKNQIIAALKANRPMLVAVATYLVLYGAFRANFFKPEVVGSGLTLSLAPTSEIIRTIIKFSLGGISMKIKLPTLDEILGLGGAFSVILALGLSSVLFFTRQKESPAFLRVPLGWLVLVYCACAPNILYAFTERYRDWVIHDSCYIGSYYSAYAIALGLALIVTGEFSSPGRIRANWGAYVSMLAAFALASMLNFNTTQSYFNEKRQDALHWSAMQQAIPALKQSNIMRLCSETFVTHTNEAQYWSYYLKGMMARGMQVRLLPNIAQHCDAYIEYKVSDDLGLIRISAGTDVIFSNF